MKPVKYTCENCNLPFEAEDALNCPRCSSRKIKRVFEKKPATITVPGTAAPERLAYSHVNMAGREGKEGWKDFHKSDVKACIECGGLDFDLNWKHKEKVCKKCGAIFPLPRRFA